MDIIHQAAIMTSTASLGNLEIIVAIHPSSRHYMVLKPPKWNAEREINHVLYFLSPFSNRTSRPKLPNSSRLNSGPCLLFPSSLHYSSNAFDHIQHIFVISLSRKNINSVAKMPGIRKYPNFCMTNPTSIFVMPAFVPHSSRRYSMLISISNSTKCSLRAEVETQESDQREEEQEG